MANGIIRYVGDYKFEVTVRENHRDDLMITQHPVETGAPITDHAFRQPSQLTVVASSTPSFLNDVSIEDFYQVMLEQQFTRQPIEVQTGKRFYENMLIRSMATETDQSTENVISLTMDLQEIILVETQETTIPNASTRSTPAATNGVADTGSKSAKTYNGTIP